MNDQSLSSRYSSKLAAYGANFVSAFDGLKWLNIDANIDFDNATRFHDLKLLQLEHSNSLNNGSLFDSNKVLALAGEFKLRQHGAVNVALFNGTQWIPYLFTAGQSNRLGSVYSLLIKDLFAFLSSDELVLPQRLLDGRIVGISLACALGSTTLLGLLFLIPFFMLFRDPDKLKEQRIQESDMVDAVSPEELLHEIDLQRRPYE